MLGQCNEIHRVKITKEKISPAKIYYYPNDIIHPLD